MSAGEDAASAYYERPFEVEANYAGWRLDLYLCEKIPRLSRARAQKLIRESLRAERPLKASTPVRPGLRFWLRRRVREEPPTTSEPVRVLYRDADLLVVDKPAGLPLHPTARYFQNTLVSRVRPLAAPGEKPDPAHRLDRETSGIVVCGTRPEITARLKTAFARGQVRKRYLAIVEGDPPFEREEVDAPLAVGGEVVRIKMRVDPQGKPARTELEVRARYRGADGTPFALVQARPLTGRQHQIRVHLAHLGLPLVGDKIYGPDERCFVRFTEHALNERDLARLRLPRHALHAAQVELAHPASGVPLALACPLPGDLAGFLNGLTRR